MEERRRRRTRTALALISPLLLASGVGCSAGDDPSGGTAAPASDEAVATTATSPSGVTGVDPPDGDQAGRDGADRTGEAVELVRFPVENDRALATPLLVEDAAVFRDARRMTGHDRETGKRLWHRDDCGSGAQVKPVDAAGLIVHMCGRELHGIDPVDGSSRWTSAAGTGMPLVADDGRVASWVRDGLAVVGAVDGSTVFHRKMTWSSAYGEHSVAATGDGWTVIAEPTGASAWDDDGTPLWEENGLTGRPHVDGDTAWVVDPGGWLHGLGRDGSRLPPRDVGTPGQDTWVLGAAGPVVVVADGNDNDNQGPDRLRAIRVGDPTGTTVVWEQELSGRSWVLEDEGLVLVSDLDGWVVRDLVSGDRLATGPERSARLAVDRRTVLVSSPSGSRLEGLLVALPPPPPPESASPPPPPPANT